MPRTIRQLVSRKDGATALEYGLITALIAATIAGTVSVLGANITTIFNNISTAISTVLGA